MTDRSDYLIRLRFVGDPVRTYPKRSVLIRLREALEVLLRAFGLKAVGAEYLGVTAEPAAI